MTLRHTPRAKPRGDRPAYYKFHAHAVAGVHKRTCDDCCADFNKEERFFDHDDEFVLGRHSGWSLNQKLCKVCMIRVMVTKLTMKVRASGYTDYTIVQQIILEITINQNKICKT